MITIVKIELWPYYLQAKAPFYTSHGQTDRRELTLVRVTLADGTQGYGEIVAFTDHAYAPETQAEARQAIQLMAPAILHQADTGIEAFAERLGTLPLGTFARHALELAVWDAVGQATQQSLTTLLGGGTPDVPVGIALGLDATAEQVEAVVDQGYQRVKLKLSPTSDLEVLATIIQAHPDVVFSVDLNASWPDDPQHRAQLRQLDQLGVTLLEEPFASVDLAALASVQTEWQQMRLSLDEHLTNLADVKAAINSQAGSALTLKPGMLGGLSATKQAQALAEDAKWLPWIGGMFASGLSRAADLALVATGPQPAFPADISASERYFVADSIQETTRLVDGNIAVPQQPGLGVTINWAVIEAQQTGPAWMTPS